MERLSPRPNEAKPKQAKGGKLIVLDRRNRRLSAAGWNELTARLVLKRHREGRLEESLVAYLLAGVGLQP